MFFRKSVDKSKSQSGKSLAVSEQQVLDALKVVMDPDLGKDIVALGFIKDIQIKNSTVKFKVELTTPACPVKELLKKQSEDAVRNIVGVEQVDVEMTAQTRGASITTPAIEASLGRVKNIIAIASGKGGVGKSTTTVNLAAALHRNGSKVGILDADVYGPSMSLMTKAENPTNGSGALLKAPVSEGIKVISAAMFQDKNKATILRGPMASQIVKQFLSQVDWGELDYLLIDYPPGTGDIQLTISQMVPVTAAVIVTTPQEVSLIDVRKAVSMFDTMKTPVLGVVETMSYFVCDGCEKKHYIFRQGGGKKIAEQFGIPLLAEIPIDPNISEKTDTGKSLRQDKELSVGGQAYLNASGEIARELSILHSTKDNTLAQFSLDWN